MIQIIMMLFSLQVFASVQEISMREIYASSATDPFGDWIEIHYLGNKPLFVESLEISNHNHRRRESVEHFKIHFEDPLLFTDFLVISNKEWLYPFDALVPPKMLLVEPRFSIRRQGAQTICVTVNEIHKTCVEIASRRAFVEKHALFPYPGTKNYLNVEMCELMHGFYITPGALPESCRGTILPWYPNLETLPSLGNAEENNLNIELNPLNNTIVIIENADRKDYSLSLCRGQKEIGICNLLETSWTSQKEFLIEPDNFRLANYVRLRDSAGSFKEIEIPSEKGKQLKLKQCVYDDKGLNFTLFIPDTLVPSNMRIIEKASQKVIRSGAFLEGGMKTFFISGAKPSQEHIVYLVHRQALFAMNILADSGHT